MIAGHRRQSWSSIPLTSPLTVVPAVPLMIPLISASAPIAAALPVLSANWHAASTFGPIEPAANSNALIAAGDDRLILRCKRGQATVRLIPKRLEGKIEQEFRCNLTGLYQLIR